MVARQLICLLPLILATGVYLVHVDGPFIYDDLPYIVDNEDLRQLWPPDWLRPADGEHGQVNGRPLLSLTLALNYRFGGLEVRGYHLLNALLHGCCAMALYGVLFQIWRRVETLAQRAEVLALCGALLWALHPLNSEVVYYVSQRSATLMGTFYLLTLYCFLRGLQGHRFWMITALFCCGLGMAAKEVMVSAPVAVLLCERALAGGSVWLVLRQRLWFYGGLSATWLVLLYGLWSRPHGTAIGFGLGVDVWTYLLNQCMVIVNYLTRIFWPHPLILDYGLAMPLAIGDVWWQGMLILLGLGASGLALVRRPLWGWAGLGFFMLLAPTSSFVPNITEVGAERRMYMPLMIAVAAWILIADGVFRHFRLRAWQVCTLFLLVVGLLGWVTIRRGADYRSPVSIWQTAVTARPLNGRGHLNLGSAMQETGDLAGATLHYRRALALNPAMEEGYYNLGIVLQMQGDGQAAEEHYLRALAIKPDQAKALHNLGQIRKSQGDWQAAESNYRRAIALDPDMDGAWSSLGKLFFAQQRLDSALVYFRHAIVLDPNLPEAYNSLGTVLALHGQYAEALIEYRRALEIDPEYQRARDNMQLAREALVGKSN